MASFKRTRWHRRLSEWDAPQPPRLTVSLILAGIAFELLFTLGLMYVPFLQGVFTTTPLGVHDWLLLFGMMLVIFLMEEIRKKLVAIWRSRKQLQRAGLNLS
jgi:hypothetical protein